MSTEPSEKTPELEAAAVPPDSAAAESAPEPSAKANDVTHSPRRKTPWSAIAIAAIVVLGVVATLALPRLRSTDTRSSAVHSIDRDSSTQPSVTASVAPAAASAAPVTRDVAEPRAIAESRKKTIVKPAVRPAVAPTTSSPAPTPVEAGNSEPTEPRIADTERAETEPAPAPPPAATTEYAPLTITGCLEVSANEDRFRLTDTEGENAPKARSWRTGFLKKRSVSVNLVGVSDALALEKQVGQRVAATGVLTSRDLKISSVRVVSPHCD